MSEYIQAAILGAVQGISEFIPISSSGHLVVVRQIFGWQDQGLAFDAVLHLATALAILIYFWKDWRDIAMGLLFRRQVREAKQARRLLGLIIVTTVPAVGAGLLLAGHVENQLRTIPVVAGLMILTGLLFLVVEKLAQPRRDLTKLTFFDALSIGLAQAVAILPGISRSGATIITGMYHGLKRELAAKYSFMAAGPIVVLAGLYSFMKLLASPAVEVVMPSLAIGFIVSLVFGIITIRWLLGWLTQNRLYVFAGYLIIVGLGLIIFNFI